MELMNQHGIATPRSFVANTPEEAEHIFTTMMNKRESIQLLYVFYFDFGFCIKSLRE